MSTCYAKEGEHGLFLRKPIKHDCVCTGLDRTDRSQREGGKHVTQAWQGVHTETAGVKSESRNRLGAQPLSPRKLVAAHRGSQRKQENSESGKQATPAVLAQLLGGLRQST